MKAHTAYLVNQFIANLVINFFVAYALSYMSLSTLNTIPFEAPLGDRFHPNMAGDLLIGSFIMGGILTLLLTAMTRSKIQKGNLDLNSLIITRWIKVIPNNLLLRAVCMGVFASMVMAFPVVAALDILKIQSMSVTLYINLHSIYCAISASVLSIIVCKRAFLDSPRHSSAGALE